MLSINKIKYLKSLSIKKYRISEQKILLEGFRIINEALKSPLLFEDIWIGDYLEPNKDVNKLIQVARKKNIRCTFETEKKINIIERILSFL